MGVQLRRLFPPSRLPFGDGGRSEGLAGDKLSPVSRVTAVIHTGDCPLCLLSAESLFSLSFLFFFWEGLLWPIKFLLPQVKRKMTPRATVHQPG